MVDKFNTYNPNLDAPSREAGLGSEGSAAFSIFNGLNIQGGRAAIPPNVDDQGLVFFTRPTMNLSYNNVINVRTLAALANKDRTSMGNAIRCSFCGPGWDVDGDKYRSTIINDKLPFIAVLSNTLQSLNGWPDYVVDTYTSPEGWDKEQVTWMDDRPTINGAFDLTANFHAMEGNPVLDLLRVWLDYGTLVGGANVLMPYPGNLVANRVDYQTKIYRFTLDKSRRFVQRVASTIAFPTAAPTGSVYNYTDETPLNQDGDVISTQFRCIVAAYDDPLIIKEFNETVALDQILMATEESRSNYMVRLNEDEKQLYNYHAFPRVNSDMEMEWWMEATEYDLLESAHKDAVEGLNATAPNIEGVS